MFHVLDPAERTFPFEGTVRLQDLETGAEVVTRPDVVRDGYRDAMDGLVARYQRELRLADIDYCLVETSKPLDAALQAYLSARRRFY